MTRTETAGIGLARAAVEPRSFAGNGEPLTERTRWFADGLRRTMIERGYHELDAPGPSVQVIVHHVDPEKARPYRRKSAPTFVIAVADVGPSPADLLRTGYPLLVRALANFAVMVAVDDGVPSAHFVTLEQGTYSVRHGGDDDEFFARVFERVEPLASSRLVIANEFRTDLPEELWKGDEQTEQIRRAGERLGALDLLPAAFPIEEILSDRDLRHVKLLYGIGGLSYGNVSARRTADRELGGFADRARRSPSLRGQPEDRELGGFADRARRSPSLRGRPEAGELGPEYWMSASGVDKSDLREIGRHVLLVRGYDAERDTMILSIPPGVKPNRVSVDAIEHWMIYREHPEVGAILHVHAWMEGTRATEINFPCGTVELATAVADLVREDADPGHAVVGQRNHGLTITGESLDEIFARIDGKLVRNVPMD